MNKNALGKIVSCLLLVCIFPLLGGCDQEDNVEAIFLGKTWKLTGIYRNSNDRQITPCSDGDEGCLEEFEEMKHTSGYFTLSFNSTERLSGRATNATFEGSCAIDGKSHAFSAALSISATDLQAYGNEYLTAINSAYKYWGDINTLKLYFKSGNDTRYLLFRIGN